RFLPVIYQWVMRRRLIYWYGKLKALEDSFDRNPGDKYLPEKQIEIERIEDAVSHIHLPLTFTDQLYNLRSHIDIVRRKMTSRATAPGAMAAEQSNTQVHPRASAKATRPFNVRRQSNRACIGVSRCASEQRDELAPIHSITSSARTRTVSGMVIPMALAVLRFTTISNLAGRSMGGSAGLVPPKIRAT